MMKRGRVGALRPEDTACAILYIPAAAAMMLVCALDSVLTVALPLCM